MQIDPSEFDALTRVDFQVFIERVFAELNPGARYSDNFHIAKIASRLEAVRRGQLKRLIINVPPRSLKSRRDVFRLSIRCRPQDRAEGALAVAVASKNQRKLRKRLRFVGQL